MSVDTISKIWKNDNSEHSGDIDTFTHKQNTVHHHFIGLSPVYNLDGTYSEDKM